MIQWLIQMWDVELFESGGNIFLNASVEKTVDQLANNSIAKGNDTNRKPFASILCGRSQGCGFANEVAKG